VASIKLEQELRKGELMKKMLRTKAFITPAALLEAAALRTIVNVFIMASHE
jgi:hypothetical protein